MVHLRYLVANGNWIDALVHGEELLKVENLTTGDLALIHRCLASARQGLGQYESAVNSGRLAVILAQEVGNWDCFGEACLDLGASYYSLRDFHKAIEAWFDYVSKLHLYGTASKYGIIIWNNIATGYFAIGEAHSAINALQKGIDAARTSGDERHQQAYRHALIEALLNAGETREVPALLGRSLAYLRNNLDAVQRVESWLWHWKLRAQFALKTRRFERARLNAIRGLRESEGHTRHQYNFHMLLAEVEVACGRRAAALNHYLAARTCAVQLRRANLESEVTEAMVQAFQ